MKKIIFGSIAGVLVVAAAAAALWWTHRPQVLQVDKNTKLTLVGVEYGKHHKYPKVVGSRGNGGSFETTNDTLVVWILQETKPSQTRYGWQAFIYDHAGTAAVTSWSRNSTQVRPGIELSGLQLDAFPRWDRTFPIRFMTWGGNGQRLVKGEFIVSNPARQKTSSAWAADPLPDTRSDGDLEVTLTSLVPGAPFPYNRGAGIPKDDPASKCVQLDYTVQQKGQSVTNWRPIQIQLSDASGNHTVGWINTLQQGKEPPKYFFQPGLWPNQSPWKLRFEFSRTSGFNDDELWTISDIPLNAGTWQDLWGNGGKNQAAPFAETNLSGFHLKLFPAIQFTDQNFGNGQKRGGLRIQADAPLDGMQLAMVKATDEQGHDLQSWGGTSWGGDSRQIQFQNLRNAKTITLTVALHKSRYLEFTVAPAPAGKTAASKN